MNGRRFCERSACETLLCCDSQVGRGRHGDGAPGRTRVCASVVGRFTHGFGQVRPPTGESEPGDVFSPCCNHTHGLVWVVLATLQIGGGWPQRCCWRPRRCGSRGGGRAPRTRAAKARRGEPWRRRAVQEVLRWLLTSPSFQVAGVSQVMLSHRAVSTHGVWCGCFQPHLQIGLGWPRQCCCGPARSSRWTLPRPPAAGGGSRGARGGSAAAGQYIPHGGGFSRCGMKSSRRGAPRTRRPAQCSTW